MSKTIRNNLTRRFGFYLDHYQSYAAFTLNGFDDQARNGFLYSSQTIYRVTLITPKYFIQAFLLVSGYQTCMCKRGNIQTEWHSYHCVILFQQD